MSSTKLYGGPGCGKTTSLIKIIKESNLPFNKIAYCTFSKKALEEMKERVLKDENISDNDLIYFRTIHAMNFHLLGIKKDQVANKKLTEFCKEKGFKLSKDITGTNLSQDKDEPIILSYENMKEKTLDDEFYIQMNKDRQDLREFNFIHPKFRNFAAQYMKFKRSYFKWMEENDYIDFIGMIEHGIKHAVLPPVDLICVDEWQDLNPLQIKQVGIWMANIGTSYHAGDDDQCIHEWAGANSASFLDLSCDNEIILEETFRLPSDILALSQYVITRNQTRKDKKLFTNKENGGIFVKKMYDLCQSLKKLSRDETVYVLVRNNFVKNLVYKDLIGYGIPVGGLVNERKAIKLMQNGHTKKYFNEDDIRIICEGSIFPASRYFNRGGKTRVFKLLKQIFPPEGYSIANLLKIGMEPAFFNDLSLKNYGYLNIDPEDMTYIEKLFNTYGYEFNPVVIMNIHQSKGLEADNVVLIPDVSYKTKSGETGDIKSIESERRVWYTAITRAKKRLFVVDNTTYSGYHSAILDRIFVFCKNH